MDPRIIDILIFIAQQLHGPNLDSADYEPEQFDFSLDIDSVVTSLANEGYSQSEIDSAVNWFFEQEQTRPQFVGTGSPAIPLTGYRILHPSERMHISADAHGFLLKIRQLGIINDIAVEEIIERALSMGWPVDLPLMKAIASSHIFDKNADEYVPRENWTGFVL